MEKAIFLNSASQLKKVTPKFKRIYFGSEFCERLIPGITEVEEVLGFARERGMEFSLVTPYVTERGIDKISGLLQKLDNSSSQDVEVIFNDWGVLELLSASRRNFSPVIGRLLTKQKRCPRLPKLLERKVNPPKVIRDRDNHQQFVLLVEKKLPPALDSYYRASNVSTVRIIHEFLKSMKVGRMELDNVSQGFEMEPLPKYLRATIYLPFVYISTTFYCPTAGCFDEKKNFLKLKPCKKECQKVFFELSHASIPRKIYLKGNTQFYENAFFNPVEAKKIGIDRIVYVLG